MSMEFTAAFIYSQNEGDVRTVGLADDQNEAKHYVLFQRTLNPSNQDRQLGHDQLHITIDDELRSTYGGVQRLLLQTDGLTIQLHAAGAAALKTEPVIAIRIDADVGDVNKLAVALQEMAPEFFEDDRQ